MTTLQTQKCRGCGCCYGYCTEAGGDPCEPCVPPHYPKTCADCKKVIRTPWEEAGCYNFSGGLSPLCSRCGDHECEGPCRP
jgi:hypothetical protein